MDVEATAAESFDALRARAESDRRPTLPEPPPVRLASVGDVTLPTVAGRETLLDAFYVGLLRFRRIEAEEFPAYEAERHALRFRVVETPPDRDEVRPIGIESPFYREIVGELQRRRADFEVVRGLSAGGDAILMRDPAGNWVAVGEYAEVR